MADEQCGWCNDLSDTGLGVCSEGGFNGDLKGQCLVELWYFEECPCESMANVHTLAHSSNNQASDSTVCYPVSLSLSLPPL